MNTISEKLLDDDWEALACQVSEGRCILMLGPDAVAIEENGKCVPLMNSFAQELLQEMPDPMKPPLPASPAQVAQAYQSFKGTQLKLQLKAEKFFSGDYCPYQVMIDLAALPFELVIDATPGRLMEEAFRQHHPPKKPRYGYYLVRGSKEDRDKDYKWSTTEPLVYHLYGHFDKRDSLVLSENNLIDFLVDIVRSENLPTKIISALKDTQNSFLFLGFGFKHWYLRILLHALGIAGSNPSYALESFDTTPDDTSVKNMISFYQQGDRKIYFFDMKLDEFTSELRKRVEERLQKRPLEQAEERYSLPINAPRVFLSYASEDIEQVNRLYDKLVAAKIKPWQDKKDLLGGDIWGDRLEEAIKAVDFFLLLITNNSIEKMNRKGPINQEYNDAQKEEKQYPEGKIFIVTAAIGEITRDNLPSSLQKRHIVGLDDKDASDRDQLDKIVSTIKRAHEKNTKKWGAK